MLELFKAPPRRTIGTRSGKLHNGATVDSLRNLEVRAVHARLRSERKEERRKHALLNLIRLWPVGVGLVLAMFAPQLRDLVSLLGTWGTWLVFPFVELANRSEFQSGTVSQMLPTIMLYAQFPLEGLLARMVLKNRVTLSGVGRHLFYYHFLAVSEVWIVSGAVWRLTVR